MAVILEQGAMSTALEPGVSRIGRATGEDLAVELDDEMASGVHAWIRITEDDRAFLIDNRSSNGTEVNDVRIDRTELKDGDRIRIGETVLKVHVLPPSNRREEDEEPEDSPLDLPDPREHLPAPVRRLIGASPLEELTPGHRTLIHFLGAAYAMRAAPDAPSLVDRLLDVVEDVLEPDAVRYTTWDARLQEVVRVRVANSGAFDEEDTPEANLEWAEDFRAPAAVNRVPFLAAPEGPVHIVLFSPFESEDPERTGITWSLVLKKDALRLPEEREFDQGFHRCGPFRHGTTSFVYTWEGAMERPRLCIGASLSLVRNRRGGRGQYRRGDALRLYHLTELFAALLLHRTEPSP